MPLCPKEIDHEKQPSRLQTCMLAGQPQPRICFSLPKGASKKISTLQISASDRCKISDFPRRRLLMSTGFGSRLATASSCGVNVVEPRKRSTAFGIYNVVEAPDRIVRDPP